MISEEQEKLLTESKFWKPRKGTKYNITMTNWRAEKRVYKKNPEELEKERLTLILDVTEIDGVKQVPIKEFSTASQVTCKLLLHSIRLAEAQGIESIHLLIERVDDKHYNIADLDIIKAALRGGA